MTTDISIPDSAGAHSAPGFPGTLADNPCGTSAALANLLDALEGDREAVIGLIGDFLGSYRDHLGRISEAVGAGNAQLLEKSAHHFKGSLGIFCRTGPLSLTERLIEMGERDILTQAPHTLELLEGEMEKLALRLKEFADAAH
jgi:HPt (histidine-containing phosphotransfer) domain-containing protein